MSRGLAWHKREKDMQKNRSASVLKMLFTTCLTLLLSACPTLDTVPSPPQEDRLKGIVNQQQPFTRSRLTNTSNKKLAVIYSVNVSPQLAANAEQARRMKPLIDYYVKDSRAVNNDVDIIFSGDFFLKAIDDMLSSKFKYVVHAKNLDDAFRNGADYAAVIDIRFEYLDFSSKTTPGPLITRHVANASTLFIDKNLQSGPDIQANNTLSTQDEPLGAEANTRRFLKQVKDLRLKTLKEYNTNLNQVVFESVSFQEDNQIAGARKQREPEERRRADARLAQSQQQLKQANESLKPIASPALDLLINRIPKGGR